MRSFQYPTFLSVLVASALIPATGFTQKAMDHNKAEMPASNRMTDGEVKKISPETGKITIQHGEIKNLGMPPMTMVFAVKDKGLLDKVQVGEKIQFTAEHEGGQMLVTQIQSRK